MLKTTHLRLILEELAATGDLDTLSKYDLSENEKELLTNLFNNGLLKQSLEYVNDLDVDQDWEYIKSRMTSNKKTVVFWKPILKYAAIFMGLMALGYYIQQRSGLEEITIPKEAITLKMGESSIKVLRKGESQEIVSSTGEIIGIQEDNKISYKANAKIGELVYHNPGVHMVKSLISNFRMEPWST